MNVQLTMVQHLDVKSNVSLRVSSTEILITQQLIERQALSLNYLPSTEIYLGIWILYKDKT